MSRERSLSAATRCGSSTAIPTRLDALRGVKFARAKAARETDPASALLDVAEEIGADLLVVGNKGMRGPRRYLGSVPSKVAHHAGCTVLIVDTA